MSLRRGPIAARAPRRRPASAPGACRGPWLRRRSSRRRVRRDPDRMSPPGRSVAGSWCSRVAASPCRHSSWNITGIPRREVSMKNRWIVVRELGHLPRGQALAGVARPCRHVRARGRRRTPHEPSPHRIDPPRRRACLPCAATGTASGRSFPRASSATSRSSTRSSHDSSGSLYFGMI